MVTGSAAQVGTESLDLKQLLRVLNAVKKGDFSPRMPVEQTGIAGKIADALNDIIELNEKMAKEFERISTVVGKEGKITQRAAITGADGSWLGCVNSVNALITDLVQPTSETARVIRAVARGDLSQTTALEIEGRQLKGEFLQTAKIVNTMVDQLNSFASEVTRVAREVGTEGKLGGQAEVKGVAGVWKDLTDNVNLMAGNLTGQVRNIADVTTAIANGDLSKKITVDVKGEILELKNTMNVMVDQLNSFASEVTRVAREVGTEGKLGGQAEVKGVAGVWKDLTDNVNLMAGNLTGQVRNIAEVSTAIANGDLSKKIAVDVKGEILELKNTINVMVDQLNSFASEVTRVAREVGTEGKLGGQAEVKGVAGVWKDLTDNVNLMAGNLTGQVRNIAEVSTAIANGDLSKKITVDVKGEILELKNTMNVMVDQLNSFASEVTRVAREVGTEGKLGGQAEVKGVAGVWKDLTDNVNLMAGNLTGQVRNIAEVSTAIANGDLSKKITVDVKGEILELKNTINVMVDQLNSFASEVTRVAREVGTEGKLGGQAEVKGVAGVWKDLTDNVNLMAGNLTGQVRNIAEVSTAIANGDLSKKIAVDVKGEILELKNTINVMVDQLNSFASEVTRVAREVGTEGKLGGQAEVKGVAGVWKDLTDNVNLMAGNLTGQVRNIADVTTAVANGNLSKKITVDVKGEILELKNTFNVMVDQLNSFASEVTRVAREVGTEGKLGGQAEVKGVAGVWKDLTDNVNQLAANLTGQVRAIGEVATAVTKGDLTRSITVDAQGELAELKDNINQMISNLRWTTQKNTEQDWLKTNLAKFTRMLQGQRELETVAKQILSELSPLVSAQHGVFYLMDVEDDSRVLRLLSSYAYKERKSLSNQFRLGEGLIGQCALEKERILITDVPSNYIRISSGLGEALPLNVVVLPVLFEGQVTAVVELASFNRFSEIHLTFLDQLTESIGIVLNTIAAAMRTEKLLTSSQLLTEELQSQQLELTETNRRLEQQAQSLQASEELLKRQQDKLRNTNDELEEKARLLAIQNSEVERKNSEIEQAKIALEDKAEQLTLTSRYKSEFLANMSHELRTPLNSMLILSRLMAENEEGNLSSKQIEFAQTIYVSGTDLLVLINDILDLAKIESGTTALEIEELPLQYLTDDTERSFRQIAHDKGLEFVISRDPDLPPSIATDPRRLQQVLKNLLSNAFKFTESGRVTLHIGWIATYGRTFTQEALNRAEQVLAFAVTDTGIGIPEDKQKIIFESFQQVDGTTSRKYGGTGLGLSISREIARLLGGEIRLVSGPGKGSTFTLYVPFQPSATSPLQPGISTVNRVFLPTYSRTISKLDSPFYLEAIVNDDRDEIHTGDKVLLIIDDDISFAQILLSVGWEAGFKGLIASSGDAGLQLTRKFKPNVIMLDRKLPDGDGWTILDRLKHDPATRHIPVHIVSVTEDRLRSMQLGAAGHLTKPVTKDLLQQTMVQTRLLIDRPTKRLLLVEHDPIEAQRLAGLIGDTDVDITVAVTGDEAVSAARDSHFDCLILDPQIPDMEGLELIRLLDRAATFQDCSVIVYNRLKSLSPKEATFREFTKNHIVKQAYTAEDVFDETVLLLYRNESSLNESKRHLLAQIRSVDKMLAGKKVLIIDDDVRNIFATTSILERHHLTILHAESGQAGISLLEMTPDISLVLLDIMMPQMDGYEVIRTLRQMPRFRSLPVVALTAKAMKGDREKCINAGASDYITKPFDHDRLISTLRVHLFGDKSVGVA